MADSWKVKLFHSRILMRSPIGLYRAGLGFLFGARLTMVEHIGRTSGSTRYVVLEVVSRPSNNSVVVASALGKQAQWYQNLVAQPQCHVSIGFRRRVSAVASMLSAEDGAQLLAEYQEKHPAVWKKLEEVISLLHGGDKNFELPLVRLALSPRPRPRSDRRART